MVKFCSELRVQLSSLRILPRSWLARRFFVISVVLGAAYGVVSPPYGVNDERAHLLRVLEIGAGTLVTRHDARGPYHMLPETERSRLLFYSDLRKDPRGRVDLGKLLARLGRSEDLGPLVRLPAGAHVYSPIPYLTIFPGVWLAKLFHLPMLCQLYLGRMTALLGFAWLAAWSVALAGRLDWIFFALGLMPMMLTQAAGVSGDSLTSGFCMVFYALIGREALLDAGPLSRRQKLIAILLCALIALCKSVYVLIPLSLFALRQRDVPRRAARLALPLLGTGLAVLALGIWALINKDLASEVGGADTRLRLSWVTGHPLAALQVVLRTLANQTFAYLVQFAALRDSLARQMPVAGGGLAGLYLGLLLLVSWGRARVTAPQRRAASMAALQLVVVGLACIAGVFCALYLADNALAAGTITGVQGRYFHPLAPAFLMPIALLGRYRLELIPAQRSALAVTTIIVLTNLACLLTLVTRYYLSATINGSSG